jgi:hypothetical protein
MSLFVVHDIRFTFRGSIIAMMAVVTATIHQTQTITVQRGVTCRCPAFG